GRAGQESGMAGEGVEKNGLEVGAGLAAVIESESAAPVGRDIDAFWAGFADLGTHVAPAHRPHRDERAEVQAGIDRRHAERHGQAHDAAAYRAFLEGIGYLASEPEPFEIGTRNVDPEIAAMAGPQLVVPALNARFLLNAVNARWGSLYDAYYGTDALPHAPAATAPGYDPARGAAVIEAARAFLDIALPLHDGSWSEITGPDDIELCEPDAYVGRTADGLMFCH